MNRLTKLLLLAQRRAPWLLATYLVLLLGATHLPDNEPHLAGLLAYDKLAHLLAYGLLGLLLSMALFRRSESTGPLAIATVVAIVMAIGAADEITQPYFNRTLDPFDWVCDVLGAALGHLAFVRARRTGWLPPHESSDGTRAS